MGKVILKNWEDGDWSELWVEEETEPGAYSLYYEGHSIPEALWCNLLRKIGVEVEVRDVPGDTEPRDL